MCVLLYVCANKIVFCYCVYVHVYNCNCSVLVGSYLATRRLATWAMLAMEGSKPPQGGPMMNGGKLPTIN